MTTWKWFSKEIKFHRVRLVCMSWALKDISAPGSEGQIPFPPMATTIIGFVILVGRVTSSLNASNCEKHEADWHHSHILWIITASTKKAIYLSWLEVKKLFHPRNFRKLCWNILLMLRQATLIVKWYEKVAPCTKYEKSPGRCYAIWTASFFLFSETSKELMEWRCKAKMISARRARS